MDHFDIWHAGGNTRFEFLMKVFSHANPRNPCFENNLK